MKNWKIFALCAAFLAAFLLSMPDLADAKRLGGGRSFSGSTMSRPSTGGYSGGFGGSTMNRQSVPMNRGSVSGGTMAMPSGTGMFGGMMGGLLAGSLIGSMLGGGSSAGAAGASAGSGGAGLLDILLLLGVGYIVLRMFRRPRRQRQDPYGEPMRRDYRGDFTQNDGVQPQFGSAWDRLRSQPANAGYTRSSYRPADFDEQEFLQGAKAAYMRMQASWDRRDLDDIASFATEDAMRVFRRQASEDPDPGLTEILNLNAEVVEVRDMGNIRQVSVVFDALMREDQHAARPEQVREMWHFVCSRSGGDTWKLDGIDQLS